MDAVFVLVVTAVRAMLSVSMIGERAVSEALPLEWSLPMRQSVPRHVAIIMDGNRRWARARGRSVRDGHAEGLERALDVLRWCRDLPVECVTLFAFASANWSRESGEVRDLMRLAMRAVRRFTPRAVEEKVQLTFLGRRDRLPRALQDLMAVAERRTATGSRRLRIAIDYSSQHAIAAALADAAPSPSPDDVHQHLTARLGSVDLLIRTGGERRLSNFLLWECANAELFFSDRLWPEFDGDSWQESLAWYAGRDRRFGR